MYDVLNLKGKHALVGGSTQGIGRAIAEQLAHLNATVTLIARNQSSLQQVCTALPTPSEQNHNYIVADYLYPNQVQTAVQTYLQTHSGFHILVNNTGGPPPGQAISGSPEQFLSAFQQHLVCNQILTQLVVPYMKQTGYGRIINIISTSIKQPIPNLGVSNTVRGAVAQWAKTLAGELAQFGITVNNVLPGTTETQRLANIISNQVERSGERREKIEQDMLANIPARRFASANEVAYAAVFLASPAAAYINGINLPVDGGRTLSL